MKTIYCGTFTVVEYLMDQATSLGITEELEKMLTTAYNSRLTDVLNHMQVQDPGLINALANHILGLNKYVIGYQVLKPGAEYYSDCMKKLLIQITGESQLKNACAKVCGNNYRVDSIYQILFSSGRFLSPKVLETIQIQGKCIILPCLAVNEDTCFGPGVNFSPDKEWNLNTSPWVRGTVEGMLESISCDTLDEDFEDVDDVEDEDFAEIEDDNPGLSEEQQMVQVEQSQKAIDAISDKEDATNIVDEFLTLRGDQQQLILEFAKSKCKLNRFNDQQIVLLYCLHLSNSDTIKDLVHTLAD